MHHAQWWLMLLDQFVLIYICFPFKLRTAWYDRLENYILGAQKHKIEPTIRKKMCKKVLPFWIINEAIFIQNSVHFQKYCSQLRMCVISFQANYIQWLSHIDSATSLLDIVVVIFAQPLVAKSWIIKTYPDPSGKHQKQYDCLNNPFVWTLHTFFNEIFTHKNSFRSQHNIVDSPPK